VLSRVPHLEVGPAARKWQDAVSNVETGIPAEGN
jgi:hypothetical protein